MRDVHCPGAPIPDRLLHRLQYLDLGGDVERGGRLVEDQEVRHADHGHRDHDALALPAAHLVGIALRHLRGVGELEQLHLLDDAPVAFRRAHDAVHEQALDQLLADEDAWIERGRGALGHVGDPASPDVAKCGAAQREKIRFSEAHPSAREARAGPAVAECRQRNGGFPCARFADEGDDLTRSYAHAHVARDRQPLLRGRLALHPQVLDGQALAHWSISRDTSRFVCASRESTSRLMPITRVAMDTAGRITDQPP